MHRRTYLASLGAAAYGFGGMIDRSRRPRRPEDDFAVETTYDVVADLGADPTGEVPIDSILAQYVQSNTRLTFPEGRYRIGTRISRFGERIHDFEMVAPEGDATFALGTGSEYWLSIGGRGSSNIRYEGFTHDVTEADPAPRLQLRARDGLIVRDVDHVGVHTGDRGPFRFDVQHPDGRGVVENVRATDGAPDGTLAVGMFVGRLHTGTLEITDCSLRGFPNNGIYQANDSEGRVIVTGGTYVNNNIANVRIAGPGSVVRGVTIVVDDEYARNERLGTNVRAIRIAGGTGMTVENCDVTMAADAPSDGAIVVHRPAGTLMIRDTRLTLAGDDITGVRAKRPLAPSIGQHSIVCTGLEITGGGVDANPRGDDRAAVSIVGRPYSQIDDSCIRLTGRDRDGIVLVDGDGSAIRNNHVEVDGDAVVVTESDRVLVHRNRRDGASCTRANHEGVEIRTSSANETEDAGDGIDARGTDGDGRTDAGEGSGDEAGGANGTETTRR